MNKIKWIIFDLGGIIVAEIGPLINHKIANILNVSDKKLKEIVSKFQRQITTGSMTLLDMYYIITKELAVQISANYLLQEHLNEYRMLGINHNADIVNFIKTLRKKYKVACLTNVETEIADICRETGLYDYFDRTFLSTELKMQKPDLEIYSKVLEELRCEANEIIFVDDKIENVIAANSLGIYGLHYSSLNQLMSDIEKICSIL
ncbi:MAG: HAD-IA family hydrolase [Ignavibacteriaceae bacterium]|jgi:epoxide hydrolase-like predicted phosphatase